MVPPECAEVFDEAANAADVPVELKIVPPVISITVRVVQSDLRAVVPTLSDGRFCAKETVFFAASILVKLLKNISALSWRTRPGLITFLLYVALMKANSGVKHCLKC